MRGLRSVVLSDSRALSNLPIVPSAGSRVKPRGTDGIPGWRPGRRCGRRTAGGRMDRLMVSGGTRLEGRVSASGSKNAVLPCMAAALLTDQPVVLHRVPDLRDVRTMAQILERLGV